MAEWLRRLTRNQMGSSRASSNLADCVVFLSEHKIMKHKIMKHKTSTENVQKHQTVVIITAVWTELSWPSG